MAQEVLMRPARHRCHHAAYPDHDPPHKGGTKENAPKPLRVRRITYLAEWTGLEPATPGVTGRYSNQLNYHSMW